MLVDGLLSFRRPASSLTGLRSVHSRDPAARRGIRRAPGSAAWRCDWLVDVDSPVPPFREIVAGVCATREEAIQELVLTDDSAWASAVGQATPVPPSPQ